MEQTNEHKDLARDLLLGQLEQSSAYRYELYYDRTSSSPLLMIASWQVDEHLNRIPESYDHYWPQDWIAEWAEIMGSTDDMSVRVQESQLVVDALLDILEERAKSDERAMSI